MFTRAFILSALPAALLMLGCGYYYIGAAQKPQHLIFYIGVLGVLWRYRSSLTAVVLQPLMGGVVAYWLYQAMSLGWSPIANGEEYGEILRKGLLTLLFVWGAALALVQPHYRRYFAQILVTIASVSAAIALALHYGAETMPERMNGLGRSQNAVQGGCLYGFALILAAWLGLQDKAKRWIWGICWAVLLVALLATASRGALLAALVAHLLLMIQVQRRAMMIVLLVGAMIVLGILVAYPELLARADGFRFFIWQEAWQQMRADWLLGMGYRAPFAVTLPYGETIYQPHSIYITALYHGGVMGLCLLCGVGAMAWKTVNHPLSKALLANAMVIGFTDFSLLWVNGEIEWLLFWLPLAMLLADNSVKLVCQTEQGEARELRGLG
jgi:hypothetical protein